MIFILMVQLLSLKLISGDNCENIFCSNIFDYVCGITKTIDDKIIIMKFQNICHLRKIECRVDEIEAITHVSNSVCDRFSTKPSRRVYDFSIVGARQACNHTCPTYCIDTYDPACAQIWKRNMKSYSLRPMINHCHIDLFSCAIGVNVTIQPLGKCYNNPSGLLFMSQIAAMKSLNLLGDSRRSFRRDQDGTDWQIQNIRRILSMAK